jgi:cell division protein FtsA
MRHYASIPFGGKNITSDIKSECQISEKLAENIKKAFGACMPEKLQNLSEKVIHIKSSSTEPNKQLPVKYLSEIITARIEEILMAILYEIEISGFADRLRSGIVVTGGCARTANICNFILDLSGYKARVGYPKPVFSHQGCEGITEASAVTSVGLILASMNDNTVNCTIAQSDVPTEVELRVIGEDGNEEAAPEGCLFKESEIEKVDPRPKVKVKKDEGKNGLITLIFKKVKSHADKAGEFVGNLYEEIVNEENQYNDTDDNDR